MTRHVRYRNEKLYPFVESSEMETSKSIIRSSEAFIQFALRAVAFRPHNAMCSMFDLEIYDFQ